MKTITTKKQLKQMIDSNEPEFYVTGKLAEDIIRAKKVTKLSKATLVVLATALAASLGTAVPSGGLSLVAVAPIATMTGVEAAVIISVVAIGGLIIAFAIYNSYNVEIVADGETPGLDDGQLKGKFKGHATLKLTQKPSKKKKK